MISGTVIMDKPKKYEDRLMSAFAFDEDDLEANQAGKLTRRQITRMNREQLSTGLGAAFILLVGIMAISAVAGAMNVAVMPPQIYAILFIMSAFFIGLSAALWLRSQRLSTDLRENWAAEVEGRIDLSVRPTRSAARYFLRVGDKRFTVKQQAFLAFKNGDPYRIYYAPRSKRILSVEWLRENDDNLLQVPPDSATAAEPDTQSNPAEADSTTSDVSASAHS